MIHHKPHEPPRTDDCALCLLQKAVKGGHHTDEGEIMAAFNEAVAAGAVVGNEDIDDDCDDMLFRIGALFGSRD